MRANRVVLYTAVALGLGLWVMLGWELGSVWQWALGLAFGIVGLLPPVRSGLAARIALIEHPTPTLRRAITVLLALGGAVFFPLCAYFQAWDFVLRFQDEHSYALQIRMLASGRLWLAALDPQIADFFASMNILTQPRYGSMYFPGTALMFVPGAWLHLAYWVMPAVAAGVGLALTYRLVLELSDGVTALLTALLLASLPQYRADAVMLLSQMPLLVLGLGAIFVGSRWRDSSPSPARGKVGEGAAVQGRSSPSAPSPALPLAGEGEKLPALLIGALLGWAAITRPLDAICFALPVGVYVVAALRRMGPRVMLPALGLMCLAVAPFAVLQGFQNRAMTGSWTTFPIDYFHSRTYPASPMGFHEIDWKHVPVPTLPQDRELMQTSAWPSFREHRLANLPRELLRVRLPLTLRTCLPIAWMAIFLPLGFARLSRRQWTLAAVPLLFFAAYAPYLFYQSHYLVVIAPALIFVSLLGVAAATRSWPMLRVPIVMFLLGLAVGTVTLTDDTTWSAWLDLVRIEQKMAQLPNKPALVLFRYHPSDPAANISFHEPVYNLQTPAIDDATIIRAHDLGLQNGRLFDYYATRGPDRTIWRYDRADDSLTKLGRTRDRRR